MKYTVKAKRGDKIDTENTKILNPKDSSKMQKKEQRTNETKNKQQCG